MLCLLWNARRDRLYDIISLCHDNRAIKLDTWWARTSIAFIYVTSSSAVYLFLPGLSYVSYSPITRPIKQWSIRLGLIPEHCCVAIFKVPDGCFGTLSLQLIKQVGDKGLQTDSWKIRRKVPLIYEQLMEVKHWKRWACFIDHFFTSEKRQSPSTLIICISEYGQQGCALK